MGSGPHLRTHHDTPTRRGEGAMAPANFPPLMKHRTHDQLFAAAGVTAALSLIGTGATVLKGSVFHFDHWPLVAGDSARGVNLPTAPIQVAAPTTPSGQSARQALLAGATRAGGTAALLPGLGGQTGVTAIGTTIPAPSGTPLP